LAGGGFFLAGRPCGPCTDKRRNELNRRLLEMEISGETYRRIRGDYGYSETALRRHKKEHLAQDLVIVQREMAKARDEALQAAHDQEVVRIGQAVAGSVVDRLNVAAGHLGKLQVIQDTVAGLLDQAEASADLRAALGFVRELREQIRLWAELEGQLASQPQVNVIQTSIYQSPAWLEVGRVLADELIDLPEVRVSVAGRLKALAEGQI